MTKIKDIENLQSQITQNLENIVDNVSGSINNLQSNINGLENNINEKLETDNLVKSLNIIPVNDEWTQLGQTVEGKLERDNLGLSSALSADGNIYATNFSNYNNENELEYIQSYKFNGFSWLPFGNKIYPDQANGYFYRVDLARNGEILAVGDYLNDGDSSDPKFNSGRVKVFKYDNEEDEWKQIGQNLDGIGLNDQLGFHLALSTNGNILTASTANGIDTNGLYTGKVNVYSFDKDNNEWLPFGQKLYGNVNQLEFFGHSSSLSGDGKILGIINYAIFSNIQYNSTTPGYVEIFKYNENDKIWEPLGQKILAENYNIISFESIKLSVDGKKFALSSRHNSWTTEDQLNNKLLGLVFKYDENNNTWYQLGQTFKTIKTNHLVNDVFNVIISDDGNFIATGEFERYTDNDISNQGVTVYRYELSINKWLPIGHKILPLNSSERNGFKMNFSADNTRLLVTDNRYNERRGAVRVYENDLLALPKNTLYSLPDSNLKIKHYDNTKYEINEDGSLGFLN